MAEPWPRDRFRAAVIADEKLTSSQRLVAIVMSEHARDRDRTSVTYTRLMRATNLSRDTVARCLTALEAEGWLVPDGPVAGRRSPVYVMRWSDDRTTAGAPWSDDQTSEPDPWSDDRTSDDARWSDGADRWSDGADWWSDDRTPSHVSSQLSSHDVDDRPASPPAVVPGEVAAVVDEVARSTSLERDREVEEAVDWLVREHHMPVDEARAFVEKNASASTAKHPARFLQAWKPADIERKRSARRGSSRRAATRLCEHDRPLPAGYEPGDICCGEAQARPHVASTVRTEAAS